MLLRLQSLSLVVMPWRKNVAVCPDAASGLEKGRKKGTLSYDLQTRVKKKKSWFVRLA